MDTKSILKEIKGLLFNQDPVLKFIDAKAGEVILRVEGDAFVPEQKVSIVTEDGVIEAGAELAGEHTLEDGTKIVLDESGVITEVIEATEELEEITEEVVEEVLEEEVVEKEEVKEEEVEMEDEIKEDKIAEMEAKINKMEEVIEEIMKNGAKYAEFSESLISKIDEMITNTPAEMEFASIKSEYSKLVDGKKSTAKTNLESITNLRKK